MKVVCVLANVPVMQQMAETMREAATKFDNSEVVFGDWIEEKEEDFSNIVLHIEKNGPNNLEIPAIFKENLDAEVIITAFCPISKDLIEQMPNLKAICVARGGVENVDLEAATKAGIKVVNAAGRNANAVSDFTVGMMLSIARNIAQSHYNIKTGCPEKTLPNAQRIPDMEGKVVGLIGFGHIGRLVAKKLAGFDVQIQVYDPYLNVATLEGKKIKKTDLETLMRTSDFISVHARLSDDTYHMISEDEIALMKENAYFINTARAGLVDYDALYTALNDHLIAGAALDVFYEEPLPANSPWLKLDNVVLTGHMGGATADAQKKSPLIAVDKLIDYMKTGNASLLMNPGVTESGEK